jgi:hypothetical protein
MTIAELRDGFRLIAWFDTTNLDFPDLLERLDALCNTKLAIPDEAVAVYRDRF